MSFIVEEPADIQRDKLERSINSIVMSLVDLIDYCLGRAKYLAKEVANKVEGILYLSRVHYDSLGSLAAPLLTMYGELTAELVEARELIRTANNLLDKFYYALPGDIGIKLKKSYASKIDEAISLYNQASELYDKYKDIIKKLEADLLSYRSLTSKRS